MTRFSLLLVGFELFSLSHEKMASATTLDRSAATRPAGPFVFGAMDSSSGGGPTASFSGMHVVHQQQQQQQQQRFESRPRYDSTMSMDMSDDDDSSLNSASGSSSSGSSSGSYDSSDFDDDSSFWSSSSLCSDFSMLSASAENNKSPTTGGIPASVKHILQHHHRPSPRVLSGTKRQYQHATPALVAMQQIPYQVPSSQQHQKQQQQTRQKRSLNQVQGATNVKVSSLIPSTFMDRLKRAAEEEQAAVTNGPTLIARKPTTVPSKPSPPPAAVQVSPSSSSGSIQIEAVATPEDNVHPHEYFLSLLRTHHNIPQDRAIPIRSMDLGRSANKDKQNSSPSSFFIQLGEQNVSAYTLEKVDATRTDNVMKLKECFESPRNEIIHCCNRYNETIIHTACRRNAMKCLQYLLSTYRNEEDTEDKRSILQLMDDYGRNPLHDAFWTASPNYDIVKLVISICPDLLLLQDVRGFCPLHYVRKEYWASWRSFLNENVDMLRPKQLV